MSKRDKFLTEQIGECWHEGCELFIASEGKFHCECGKWMSYPHRQTFSTSDGFFKLWEWSQQQEWWYDFLNKDQCFGFAVSIELVNPDRFADAIYQFLKEREI